eukprot:jgi/Botrbrau1/19209/Bobra.0077s0110.1
MNGHAAIKDPGYYSFTNVLIIRGQTCHHANLEFAHDYFLKATQRTTVQRLEKEGTFQPKNMPPLLDNPEEICTAIRHLGKDKGSKQPSRHSTAFTVLNKELVIYKTKFQFAYSISPTHLQDIVLTVSVWPTETYLVETFDKCYETGRVGYAFYIAPDLYKLQRPDSNPDPLFFTADHISMITISPQGDVEITSIPAALARIKANSVMLTKDFEAEEIDGKVPLKITGELIITNVPEAFEKHLFIQGENVLGTMATCTEWELYEDLLGFQIPKTGTSAAGLKAKIEQSIGVGNQSAKPVPVFILDHKPGLYVQKTPPQGFSSPDIEMPLDDFGITTTEDTSHGILRSDAKINLPTSSSQFSPVTPGSRPPIDIDIEDDLIQLTQEP